MKMLNLLHLEQKVGLKQMINLHGTYDTNSEVKFKTIILKLKLQNYSDTYVPVKTAITVARQGADPSSELIMSKILIY